MKLYPDGAYFAECLECKKLDMYTFRDRGREYEWSIVCASCGHEGPAMNSANNARLAWNGEKFRGKTIRDDVSCTLESLEEVNRKLDLLIDKLIYPNADADK